MEISPFLHIIFFRFVVEADSAIKDFTIIAEYTGDVDYMRRREKDDGDSIMALLFTDSPDKDLVICPDRRGNIARFISGINNHTRYILVPAKSSCADFTGLCLD